MSSIQLLLSSASNGTVFKAADCASAATQALGKHSGWLIFGRPADQGAVGALPLLSNTYLAFGPCQFVACSSNLTSTFFPSRHQYSITMVVALTSRVVKAFGPPQAPKTEGALRFGILGAANVA